MELTHDGIHEFAAQALDLPRSRVQVFADAYVPALAGSQIAGIRVLYIGSVSPEARAVAYDAIRERLPDMYALTVSEDRTLGPFVKGPSFLPLPPEDEFRWRLRLDLAPVASMPWHAGAICHAAEDSDE
jgi:hypothetical protein